MWTRRALFAPLLLSATPRPANSLLWSDLPARAQALAAQLHLTADNWSTWQHHQRQSLERRIHQGTAEHVTYFLLQSRSFCDDAPLAPASLLNATGIPSAARRRIDRYQATPPTTDRHRLLRQIHDAAEWPPERCYHHTLAFLRARTREPLDLLYHQRGLSSDTAPAALQPLSQITSAAQRILLAGPGLDFTRRENFRDELPLVSHQLLHLRERFPRAVIQTIDIRPEVIAHLGAHRIDVTTETAPGAPFDLVIATNLLLYFEDRELLTALAGFAKVLAPGGRLLHNDQRFAAKIFGESLGLPMEKFEPLYVDTRKGIEQWDRAVIHRKS